LEVLVFFDYLLDADLTQVPLLRSDVLVVGSGVAGCSAALAAIEAGAEHIVILAKGQVGENNTSRAQGGVAVAMGDDDSLEAHVSDTCKAGGGLCCLAAVEKLVAEGPERIRDLISWGASFDCLEGSKSLARTAEGGHSVRRVLHASGDATGREFQRVLGQRVAGNSSVTLLENHFVVDLLHDAGTVFGALVMDTRSGKFLQIMAGSTVLATGGMGRVYRETTNPDVATGDGVALALRAGAELTDVEFVQFHPTTLYLAGAPRFLISEAVRGEGAVLLNAARERFVHSLDQRGELAPRDIVSQAIVKEMRSEGSNCVYLDLSPISQSIEKRFPSIFRICRDFGLDIRSKPIPVRPSAHYAMGGVRTDLNGRTNIRHLLAAGECAATGVHGANRLASNSLLEGLVYGRSAGLAAAEDAADGTDRKYPHRHLPRASGPRDVPIDVEDLARSLKSLMWRAAGVFRQGEDLEVASRHLDFWRQYAYREEQRSPAALELQNMLAVSAVVLRAALARTESRGGHQRLDYPKTIDPDWQRHLIFTREDL
jgi:L-aspartate oxidase